MPDTIDPARFPPGFVWGASTASYQIEGAVKEDGRGPSIWDTFSHMPDKIDSGETGDLTCDHYHRYGEDIALMKTLGLDAYRFSIAWPRILPQGRGAVNEKGLEFYDRLVDCILEAGIEPWPCLYHWDLPQALQDDGGGWRNRACADAFADYSDIITRRLGDRARNWLTFNEPNVFSIFGYLIGYHAPGLADHDGFLDAVHTVNLAHGKACPVIRANVRDARIGLAPNMQPVRAASASPADAQAAKVLDAYWNRAFAEPMVHGGYDPVLTERLGARIHDGDLETICQPLDWFGMNYYSPLDAAAADNPSGMRLAPPPPGAELSLMGWEVHPPSFTQMLVEVSQRYGLPVYVTENGTADALSPSADGEIADRERISYLSRHLSALLEAREAGADVRGYLTWTLVDNFEWAKGYATRFGLVHCDFTSQKRTPKASYHWLKALIEQTRHRRA